MKKIIFGVVILLLLLSLSFVFMDKGVVSSSLMFSSPSLHHPFGFDSLGRDLLKRVSFGTLSSLSVGLLCSIFTIIISVIFSILFSYVRGGKFVTKAIFNSFRSIPMFVLSLFIVLLFGNGIIRVVFAISFSSSLSFSKLLSSVIEKEKTSDENTALKGLGLKKGTVFFKHTLPSLFPYIKEQFFLTFLHSFLCESTLSFLGLGLKITTPTLGGIIAEGKDYIFLYPHIVIFPLLIILVISLSLLLISSGLRDLNSSFKRK